MDDSKINLVPVDIKDKKILSDLIKEYQKEILKQEKVEEYKYLDSYWQDSSSYPYFIMFNGTVVGFVLVNDFTLVEKGARSISEFYIKKEFRNKGVGKLAAIKTFDLFPGKWEIRELIDNIAAQNFWRKVIGKYTNGNFKEITFDKKDYHRLVQIFDNS